MAGLVNAGKGEKLGKGKPKRRQREGKEEPRVGKKRTEKTKRNRRIESLPSDGCKWWLVEKRERYLLWVEKCGKLSGLRSMEPSESALRMG